MHRGCEPHLISKPVGEPQGAHLAANATISTTTRLVSHASVAFSEASGAFSREPADAVEVALADALTNAAAAGRFDEPFIAAFTLAQVADAAVDSWRLVP